MQKIIDLGICALASMFNINIVGSVQRLAGIGISFQVENMKAGLLEDNCAFTHLFE